MSCGQAGLSWVGTGQARVVACELSHGILRVEACTGSFPQHVRHTGVNQLGGYGGMQVPQSESGGSGSCRSAVKSMVAVRRAQLEQFVVFLFGNACVGLGNMGATLCANPASQPPCAHWFFCGLVVVPWFRLGWGLGFGAAWGKQTYLWWPLWVHHCAWAGQQPDTATGRREVGKLFPKVHSAMQLRQVLR
jgi:hypothetical protein